MGCAFLLGEPIMVVWRSYDHAETRMAHLPSSGDFRFIVRLIET